MHHPPTRLATLLALILVLWPGASPVLAAEPLKVAFVHENPVGQGGWTLSHELAREKIEAHFGDAITTTALDGVVPGGDTERVLTKLARGGQQLIFATSFGHMSAAARVSRRFPRVIFEHAAGYTLGRNLGTYQIRAYQGRYLAGYAAGLVTRTNRLGYVGAFPIPEVMRGINAFTLGAKAANPDAQVDVIWISTWSDASRSREAAELLVSKQADVITHHTETSAVVQAADQRGVWSVGYQTDRSAFAPRHHLVSIAHNWFPIYRDKIQSVLDGNWSPEANWVGLEQDATRLEGWGDKVPESVREQVMAQQSRLLSGDLRVFAGPLTDADGQQQVAAGEVITDEALLKMEWLLEGIGGDVPR
ncbi:MAG: BMP family ABC transporter substrate-binding protein [Halieaceae bacterium]|jgi:simple sugar transport system substrate-binding protein|nr:BMP family ABC transporter substrate-binding protein [Halieaceae bacterium]